MINISNNFKIVEELINKCDIIITILDEQKYKIKSAKGNCFDCRYKVNATIKDILTGKSLSVENLSISRIVDLDSPIEDELAIKRTDMKVCFSMEECVVMNIVSDAGFYQEYMRKSKPARNVFKKTVQPDEKFIELSRMKQLYDFIVR